MAKLYRFDNGFVGTLIDFGAKFGKSKEVGFKSARRPVSALRYNRMTYDEQMAYDHAARFAVPAYRLFMPDDSSYEISKTEFDSLELPVTVKELAKNYPMKHPKHMIKFLYKVDTNRYLENSFAKAMELYAKDAKKMAIALLYGAGYIHTGNYKSYEVDVRINHTDVYVTVRFNTNGCASDSAERIECLFSSTYENDGCSYCQLDTIDRYIGGKEARLFNRWTANWHEGDFNGYLRHTWFNQDVGNASELG